MTPGSDMKEAFGDVDDFNLKGGLKTMGEALDRGMVLVMSLWDDAEANMLWLDADYPTSRSPTVPGVNRGPCNQDTGRPSFLRAKFPDARVKYSNIKVGSLSGRWVEPSCQVVFMVWMGNCGLKMTFSWIRGEEK